MCVVDIDLLNFLYLPLDFYPESVSFHTPHRVFGLCSNARLVGLGQHYLGYGNVRLILPAPQTRE